MAEPVDPARHELLSAFVEAGAEVILIGGAALESHGMAYRTDDVDLTPERSQENLERIAAVLNSLHCKLVIDPTDSQQNVALPADYFTARTLARQDVWNLATDHGKVDLSFHPAGFDRGYDELVDRATPIPVAHTQIVLRVAALADVEHSKRTAGRPKDLLYLGSVNRVPEPADPALADVKRIDQVNTPTPPTTRPPQGSVGPRHNADPPRPPWAS